ncbi:MAG: HU family DNA-binding protein [Prevotella sp.]|nr:HU family DNA-binding protein [Bacteroidales bacterium]MDY3742067.1 HU family DNA-binding protein [Prevotella sp.]MDY4463660.1 HU family DNA-binding protein [Prevotella sp.]MDY5877316.1 HU family DNA-binding protein [Prevotella sp.]
MSNIKDLAKIVADRYDMHQQDAEKFMDDMFSLIRSALINDEQVKIKGLGTFKVQTVKERASVNVNTGEKVMINSHDRISFTPDATMRDSVNKPFAHFVTVPLNEGVVFDDMDDMSKVADSTEHKGRNLKSDGYDILEHSAETTVTANIDTGVNTDTGINTGQEDIVETLSSELQPAASLKKAGQEDIVETVATPVDNVSNVAAHEAETAIPKADQHERKAVMQMVQDDENRVDNSEQDEIGNDMPEQSVGKLNVMAIDTAEDSISDKENQEPAIVSLSEPEEYKTNDNQTEENTTAMSDEKNLNPSVAEDNDHSFLISLLLGLAVFVVGVIVGRATADITMQDVKAYLGLKPEVKVHVIYKRLPAPSPEKKDSTAGKKDVPTAENKKVAPAAVGKTDKNTIKVADTEKNPVEKKAADKPMANENYNKDPRVRTGAYIITGVQQTVTAAEGETVASISKRYLGPGMECYVEALNGKTISAGQKVKIPALKLKKKVSRQ